MSNLSIQSQADAIRLPVNLPGHVCDVTACDALAKGIQGKRTSPSAVIGGRVRQPALRYTKHPISTRSSTEDRLSNLSIQSQADAIRLPVILPRTRRLRLLRSRKTPLRELLPVPDFLECTPSNAQSACHFEQPGPSIRPAKKLRAAPNTY